MPKHLLLALILSGSLFSQPAFAFERIKVMALFKDKAVVLIDGTRRVLEKGKTTAEDVTLLSSNSREALIEFNGQQFTLTLSGSIGSTFTAPPRSAAQHIAPDKHGMYRVNGSINGHALAFLVDTGATLVAMNEHTAKRLGIQYRLEGKQGLANTAAGIVKIYTVQLDRVRVGDIELKNIEASIHDGDFPNITLLGMSFLGQLDMQREGRILKLRKMY